MTVSRRMFMGQAALAAFAAGVSRSPARAQNAARVVIVGAGAGGATLAMYLRQLAPEIAVTLIERNAQMTTGSFSNHVIGGFKPIEQITHSYDQLKARGVSWVQSVAVDVDTARKVVTLLDGTKIYYDRLVLAPGVDLKFETIEGYSATTAKTLPHAWRGPEQMLNLKAQLDGLADGGTVVMSIPAEPYSCPAAAYERVCVIAHFLKTRKARSKLIVLDANRAFAMQEIFGDAFKTYYGGVLEFLPSTPTANFEAASVDATSRMVMTRSGIGFTGSVLNIIPAQTAGGIAVRAGCVEGDWCPVEPDTFASRRVKDVHVIGDCAIASQMPRTAFAANNQAKVLAGHLAQVLAGKENFPVRLRDAVWSFVAPDDTIKAGAAYLPGMKDGRTLLIASDRFSSVAGDDRAERRANVDEAVGWYSGIMNDMLGAG